MPTTGIYFIPVPPNVSENFLPSQVVFNALAADHHVEPLPNWNLEHRLFRETNLGAHSSTAGTMAFLQVLSSSFHGGNSYIGISRMSSAKPADGKNMPETQQTIITVPTGHGSDEFYAMIASRFSPLWQRRHLTQITNGQAYEVGSFIVRFGELRDKPTGQGGTQPLRGTLVEISTSDTDDDFEGTAEEAIRQFWTEMDIAEAREFMQTSSRDGGVDSVKTWLEVLRIRT